MNFQLYANNRQGSRNSVSGRGNISGNRRGTRGAEMMYRKQDRVDLILQTRITAALEKYDADAKIRGEIQDKLNMYCCNVAIARECNDKSAIRRLRAELINYLNTI